MIVRTTDERRVWAHQVCVLAPQYTELIRHPYAPRALVMHYVARTRRHILEWLAYVPLSRRKSVDEINLITDHIRIPKPARGVERNSGPLILLICASPISGKDDNA